MATGETILGGRYRLLGVLGDGGMARVYRAEDERLHRIVAVKTLHRQYVGQPAFIRRFEQEAQLAAQLTHPNIVAIYDVGRDDDAYYIVMEYVEGRSLKALIAREAPLPLDRVVPIMRQLGQALDAAHAHGVIHRDIKPENILLTPQDEVKVSDFGIARALTGAAQTATGMVLGSVSYFSPEQAQGKPATAESDIYSSGIVLYEMLTGRLPFAADNPLATAMQHITQPPAPPRALVPTLPPGIDAVVSKALAKRPEDRFHSGVALADALSAAAVLRDTIPAGAAPGRPAAAPRPRSQPAPTVRVPPVVAVRPRRRSAAVPLLLLLLLGGGAAYAATTGTFGRLLALTPVTSPTASATLPPSATQPSTSTAAAATTATGNAGGAGGMVPGASATSSNTAVQATPSASNTAAPRKTAASPSASVTASPTPTARQSTATPRPSATKTPTSRRRIGDSAVGHSTTVRADIATGSGFVSGADGSFAPTTPRDTFAPSSSIFATITLHNAPPGARVGALWTFPGGKKIPYPCAQCPSPRPGSPTLSYWVEQQAAGPGAYTVSALVNGHAVGAHRFTVRAGGSTSSPGSAGQQPQPVPGDLAASKPKPGKGHKHKNGHDNKKAGTGVHGDSAGNGGDSAGTNTDNSSSNTAGDSLVIG